METDKSQQINLVSCLSKRPLYLRRFVLDLLPTLIIFFMQQFNFLWLFKVRPGPGSALVRLPGSGSALKPMRMHNTGEKTTRHGHVCTVYQLMEAGLLVFPYKPATPNKNKIRNLLAHYRFFFSLGSNPDIPQKSWSGRHTLAHQKNIQKKVSSFPHKERSQ